MAALQRSGGCQRIPEGWIDIDPKHVEEYRQASKELRSRLGGFSRIEGFRIPDTLHTLLEQEEVHVVLDDVQSEAIKNFHRIVDSPADVEFRLQVIESDGRSVLEIVPVYNYGRFSLPMPNTCRHRPGGSPGSGGEMLGSELIRKTANGSKLAIKRLGLQPSTNGFTFLASQRDKVIEVFSLLGSIVQLPSYEEFLKQLADFDELDDVTLPASLRPGITFRPYQKEGFNWLAFLRRFGLNGILADDMGLGKTLQTLAILQRAKEQGQGKSPSLIICPTSVVSNWQSEAEKFFTDCPVILYTGNQSEAQRRKHSAPAQRSPNGLAGSLVVTSYDIARRDYKELKPDSLAVRHRGRGAQYQESRRQENQSHQGHPAQHKLAPDGDARSRTSWKNCGRCSTLRCPDSWALARAFGTSTGVTTRSSGMRCGKGRAT